MIVGWIGRITQQNGGFTVLARRTFIDDVFLVYVAGIQQALMPPAGAAVPLFSQLVIALDVSDKVTHTLNGRAAEKLCQAPFEVTLADLVLVKVTTPYEPIALFNTQGVNSSNSAILMPWKLCRITRS